MDVRQLPVTTKTEMMSHFDEWVTDPEVSRQGVEAFIADPSLIGHDYLSRYVVCTTSGSTGTPAILVHDHGALIVYNVLGYIRSLPVFMSTLRNIWVLVRGKGYLASVFVTGGHFLGNTMMARRIRTMPWRARTQRLFSALTPSAELVRRLNALQPVMLGGYPSALEVLAKEQQAGKLHIHPVVINAAGETLTDSARGQIAAAFGCTVGNYYGSSEAVGLTFECRHHQLHVNSDWYLLEPVDEENRPVPPGELSSAVLVTNLANWVQPLIRYKMGDRVAISTDPCPCGSPFPVIRVIGRTDEVLAFPTPEGRAVQILPLAIVTVAEETPGVYSCQLIQTEPRTLRVRLAMKEACEAQAVWEALQARLTAYLTEQGAASIAIERAPEPPQLHPVSGKFQQGVAFAEAAHLFNQAGEYLRVRARYEQAAPLLVRALAIREQQLGPEHPDTASSLNDLAGLYWAQGKYAEVEPLYQRALAIYEHELGVSHPTTQIIRQNYTALLQAFSPRNEKH